MVGYACLADEAKALCCPAAWVWGEVREYEEVRAVCVFPCFVSFAEDVKGGVDVCSDVICSLSVGVVRTKWGDGGDIVA